jgi:hypothetical protein
MKKIIVLKEVWQVENNLLTPSLKIKRNEIESSICSLRRMVRPKWFVNIQP